MRSVILSVLLFSLLLPASGVAETSDTDVKITTREENGEYVVVGTNYSEVMPYYVILDFPKLTNMKTSEPIPARFVLPPATSQDLMTVWRARRDRAAGYRLSSQVGRGDPDAVHKDRYAYLPPYAHGTKHMVGQGYFGPTTHRDMRALDFNMDEGTPVHAARGGVVIAVKEDSNIGGPEKKFAEHGNFIEILHDDGTWANYAHLKQHGAHVQVGDRVDAGAFIGYSGKTGRASGPHLHFAVYRASWQSPTPETVATLFRSVDGWPIELKQGGFYYSDHPGNPPFHIERAADFSDATFVGHAETIPTDGKVTIRQKKIDEKAFLFARNGTSVEQRVTVRVTEKNNVKASRTVPYTVDISPATEIFLFSIVRDKPEDFGYGMTYEYVPAPQPSPSSRHRPRPRK